MAASVAVQSQHQQGFLTPDQQSHNGHSGSRLPSSGNQATPVWQNPNPPLPRGRAPRDPLAVTTKLQCSTLQDMERQLREYLDNRPAAPEHCTCELTLWAGASFLVKVDYVPPNLRGNQQPQDVGMLQAVADFNSQRPQPTSTDGRDTTLSVLDALQQLNDPKETMKRQRAISKVCVAAVQKTDGYRYSFHNSWKSGEDNAYRFSYYCNDSLLNKDRVANGKSGSQGKRATKPVYDCKGVLSIKFSATRQCIDVVYRHVPCHETYEERAPPPRKNSKRRAEWETKNPERVKVAKPSSESAEPENSPTIEPAPPLKKKKKKGNEPARSAEAELREQSMFSLLELMRPHEEPKKPEQAPPPPSPPPPPPPAVTSLPIAPHQSSQASGGSQKTPSRRQPRSSAQCAICISRRTKCDGTKPKCRTCIDKGWPCFYQAEQSGNAPPIQVDHTSPQMPGNPAQLPGFDATHQSDLAALTLANQNEDLQKEIANVRQDQINAQKEAFDLKTQLAEMRKTLESLKSENTRLHTPQPQQISHPPPQMPQQSSMNVVQHERSRSSQQHHNLPSTPQQPSYTPQQYQTSAQHMYQAPSQGTQHSRTHTQHGQPVYGQTGDSRAQAVTQQQPANAWGQGIYGAYQQNQHSGGMLPSTHMMGGYR